ncbi:MAG: polysaccharide biosynthesis/export family protein [Gemmatimonadaceae bacterium]|nr:polysaccharide biosynthesis/export family protein [Gemmatimonadaceae bacterium]
MPLRLRSLILASALAAGACARAPQAAMKPFSPGSGWVAQPGDQLQMRVWREPDFTTETVVAANGTAVFPGLGRIPVAGIRYDSLLRYLEGSLASRLQQPSVDLRILRPLAIVGGVRAQGLALVGPEMTVRDAVAKAGATFGFGRNPQLAHVVARDSSLVQLAPDTPLGLVDLSPGDALFVQDEKWYVRQQPLLFALGAIGTVVVVVGQVLLFLK